MSKKTPRKNLRSHPVRAEEMLQAIFTATERVLVKRGYAGTTTNHIAEVAGISIGSFYRYFKNKEAVVAALLNSSFNFSNDPNAVLIAFAKSPSGLPPPVGDKIVQNKLWL